MTDRTSFNVCGRVFSNVELEQSFAPGSNKVLIRRRKRALKNVRENAKLVKLDDDASKPVSENVVSQIQKVISTLQEDPELSALPPGKDTNQKKDQYSEKKKEDKPSKKKEKEANESTSQDAKKSGKENTNVQENIVKEIEKKDDMKKDEQIKPATPKKTEMSENDKKKDETKATENKTEAPQDEIIKVAVKPEDLKINGKPEDVKVIEPQKDKDEKITWLILSDGSVRDSSKFSEDMYEDTLKPVKMVKEPVKETKLKLEEEVKPEVTLVKKQEPNLTERIKPAAVVEETKVIEMAKPEEKPIPQLLSIDKPEVSMEPMKEEETPEVIMEEPKTVEYSREEAEQKFLSKIGCDGSYLLANDRKFCGTFLRKKIPNADEISANGKFFFSFF